MAVMITVFRGLTSYCLMAVYRLLTKVSKIPVRFESNLSLK